eukprot:4973505-Prymnesium_polylepis.1
MSARPSAAQRTRSSRCTGANVKSSHSLCDDEGRAQGGCGRGRPGGRAEHRPRSDLARHSRGG